MKGKINNISTAELLRIFETKLKKNMKMETFIKICEELKTNLEKETENANTRSTRMARSNTIIKNKLGETYYKISFNILRPTRADKLKQIAEQKEIYMSRLQNRIKLDFNTYINTIDALKISENFDDLVVCVSLVTGRRITEITTRGKFTKVGDPHFVLFGGQLKKKTGMTNNPYEIPLIGMESDELIKIIEKIRNIKDLSKLSNEKIVSVTSKRPNNILQSIFGLNVTTEVIRGAYAYICYRMYSNNSISEIIYGSKVLGHKESDLNTFAQNYNRTYVEMNDYSKITDIGKIMEKILKKLDNIAENVKK